MDLNTRISLKVSFLSIALLFVSFGLFNCREVETPTPGGEEYYPLQVGMHWIYSVDSMRYDAFTGDSTFSSFELKEEVTGIFNIDSQGRRSMIITTYVRGDSSMAWKYHLTGTRWVDTYKAVNTEENTSVVKMIFPIRERKSWDANQLNIQGQRLFRYRSVDQPYMMNGLAFSNTVKIEQESVISAFILLDFSEVYAKSIGLIEKSATKIEWTKGKKDGYRISWKLNSFAEK